MAWLFHKNTHPELWILYLVHYSWISNTESGKNQKFPPHPATEKKRLIFNLPELRLMCKYY